MKDSVILCTLLLFAIVAFFERDHWMPKQPPEIVYIHAPTPKPAPVRHLAPEGTFFIVEYVSVHVAHGIVGFVPGQEVHFISADEAKGTLLVSDGKYQTEVNPMQVTNDLDVAAMARRQDETGQRQLEASQDAARTEDEKIRRGLDVAHANDVAKVHAGTGIGGHSALDQQAQAASSFDRAALRNGYYYGSPYYYLHRQYYSTYYYP